jgi:hypothetical protein
MLMCSISSPLSSISRPVESTRSGGGKNCGLKNVVAIKCHRRINAMMEAT